MHTFVQILIFYILDVQGVVLAGCLLAVGCLEVGAGVEVGCRL